MFIISSVIDVSTIGMQNHTNWQTELHEFYIIFATQIKHSEKYLFYWKKNMQPENRVLMLLYYKEVKSVNSFMVTWVWKL